MHIKLFGKEQ